jgi:hypothetical protein
LDRFCKVSYGHLLRPPKSTDTEGKRYCIWNVYGQGMYTAIECPLVMQSASREAARYRGIFCPRKCLHKYVEVGGTVNTLTESGPQCTFSTNWTRPLKFFRSFPNINLVTGMTIFQGRSKSIRSGLFHDSSYTEIYGDIFQQRTRTRRNHTVTNYSQSYGNAWHLPRGHAP